jgi:sugar lactone lactonase YvrE
MYHIDSLTHAVMCYEYDTCTGSIEKHHAAIKIPESLGTPDGMAIDSDGMLWVAMWGGWRVLHINPQNSRIIDSIELPTEQVTSCAFGGRNLDELYISTACTTLSDKKLAEQIHAGDMFVVRTSTCGLEPYRYSG